MLMAWETCSEITFPQVHSDSLLICYGKKWFLIVLNYIFVFQAEHLSVLCCPFEFCGKLASFVFFSHFSVDLLVFISGLTVFVRALRA